MEPHSCPQFFVTDMVYLLILVFFFFFLVYFKCSNLFLTFSFPKMSFCHLTTSLACFTTCFKECVCYQSVFSDNLHLNWVWAVSQLIAVTIWDSFHKPAYISGFMENSHFYHSLLFLGVCVSSVSAYKRGDIFWVTNLVKLFWPY